MNRSDKKGTNRLRFLPALVPQKEWNQLDYPTITVANLNKNLSRPTVRTKLI